MQAESSTNSMEKMDGSLYRRMIRGGLAILKQKRQEVNDLNVFPVPDGDTGTNMFLTLSEAYQELKSSSDKSVSSLSQILSQASMMSARGNSGVILSQLLRGFAQAMTDQKYITPALLARGLEASARVAYQAVMKPVEGTILTVARAVGEGASQAVEKGRGDILDVLEAAIEEGSRTLKRTPEMLDVLGEAGVVDAGGQGYLFILMGGLASLKGKNFFGGEKDLQVISTTRGEEEKKKAELEYLYCTELLIRGEAIFLDSLRSELEKFGDSLLVVGSKDLARVHIHTNHPGEVLEYGLKWGALSRINISNMQEQSEKHMHTWEEEEVKQEEKKKEEREEFKAKDEKEQVAEERTALKPELGTIAVVSGEGLKEIFSGLGVDSVIEGGQGQNPSTKDLVEAVQEINSEKMLIFPNNKNIIGAAEQVEELVDSQVFVVPSRSIPEGIAALMAYDPSKKPSILVEEMENEMEEIKTGELTYAIRDSELNGHQIEKGNVLGIYEGELEIVTTDCNQGLLKLLQVMVDDDDSLITLYAGEAVEEDESSKLQDLLQASFPDCEIEIYPGGQSLYYYYISVE